MCKEKIFNKQFQNQVSSNNETPLFCFSEMENWECK